MLNYIKSENYKTGIEYNDNYLTIYLMTFGTARKQKIKERSGYFCQVCGDWQQPHPEDTQSRLEAHSTDKTHHDTGMSVCSRKLNPCHTKLHDITDDPTELEIISRTVVQLNGLDMTLRMLKAGESEKRIVRVVNRVCDIKNIPPKRYSGGY